MDSSREFNVLAGLHEQTHPPPARPGNWLAHNEALKRRGSLTIWCDPAMTWEATPAGKRGRQPDQCDAAIQELPYDESAVWLGAEADDRVFRKSVVDRPGLAWTGRRLTSAP
jgi:Transposase DDE domain